MFLLFIYLCVYSDFLMMDGFNKVKFILNKVVELNMLVVVIID